MLTSSLPTDAPGGVPVAAWRRMDAALVARSAAGIPRAGVVPANYDAIVTGAPDTMAYRIGQFVAFTSRNGVGVERVANDSMEIRATDAAPSGNSRKDVIWVRSLFPVDGDMSDAPEFGVTKGAAALSPTKPSIPPGALELAVAEVPASAITGQDTVITQTHPYTVMAGGTVALRNQPEQDAWSPADGARAFRLDTQDLVVRAGGVWLPELRTRGGAVEMSTSADGVVVVNHGLGRIPKSVVGNISWESPIIPKQLKFYPSPQTFTTTTFAAVIVRSDTDSGYVSAPVKFTWIAVG